MYIISTEAFEVKSMSSKPGNIKIMRDTIKQIIPVMIKPDETVDPIAFLLFLFE